MRFHCSGGVTSLTSCCNGCSGGGIFCGGDGRGCTLGAVSISYKYAKNLACSSGICFSDLAGLSIEYNIMATTMKPIATYGTQILDFGGSILGNWYNSFSIYNDIDSLICKE